MVFQLEVYYKVDRLLTGLTAQPNGTNARWYSNKRSQKIFNFCITNYSKIFEYFELFKYYSNIFYRTNNIRYSIWTIWLRQIIFDSDQNRYSFVHCLYFCTPSIFEVGKTQLGGSTSQSVNLEPYPSRGLKYFFSFSTFSDKFRKKLLANYPPLCISSETKTLTQQYFN